MSDIIARWINNDIQLSKKVSSFEKDFANGYYMGELLSKIGAKINLHSLSNKDTPKDKAVNFKQLETCLKSIGVKTDTKLFEAIANGERGAALKIIYQIKMSYDNNSSLRAPSPGKSMASSSLPPIKSRENTNLKGSAGGTREMTAKDMVNQKLMGLLEKYEVNRTKNEEKASKEFQEEQRRYQSLKAEARRIELEKMHQNMEYMKQFDEKGWEHWRTNQENKKIRVEKEHQLEEKMTMRIKNRISEAEKAEREEVLSRFNEYEINAQRLGIELEHDPDQEKKVEKAKTTVSGIMMKIKERQELHDLARKDREKRRRKMMVDQMKQQKEIEQRKFEESQVHKFKEQAQRERAINQEQYRKDRIKAMKVENRVALDEQYQAKVSKEKEVVMAREASRAAEDRARREEETKKLKAEKRIYMLERKIAKRKTHTVMMHMIFQQIFEVADICFDYQERNNTIQIDPKFWKDLTAVFSSETGIVPKKPIRHTEDTSIKDGSESARASLENLTLSELYNYMNGLGNWKMAFRPEPGYTDNSAVLLAIEPMNNFALGSILHNLIDRRFPVPTLEAPAENVPSYLPLKLVVTGPAFSGRRTMAKYLNSKYGVQIVDYDELIKEALDLSNPNKAAQEKEDPKKAKKAGKNPKDKEPEVKPVNQELLEIGKAMTEYVEKSQPIPDELSIRAIISKLKELFPPMTHEQILEEFKALKAEEEKRISEAAKALEKEDAKSKKGSKKATLKTGDSDGAILSKKPYYTKGWVLVGFPNTPAQYKKFERALSGYVAEEERINAEAEKKKERLDALVKAPPKTVEKKRLFEGGIDCAILLDVTREECLRRALGRRIDPKTGNIYHIEDNPPPANDNALKDRLQPFSGVEDQEPRIVEKFNVFEERKEFILDWFQNFGFEEEELFSFLRLDQNPLADIQAKVDNYLRTILWHKILPLEKKVETGDLSSPRGGLPSPRGLASPRDDPKNKSSISDKKSLVGEKKETEEDRLTDDKLLGSDKGGQDNQTINVLSSMAQGPADGNNLINMSGSFMEASVAKVNQQTIGKDTIYNLWEEIQEGYIQLAGNTFLSLKDQDNYINSKFREIQDRFLDLISREDIKNQLVDRFRDGYNRFMTENPSLREDHHTKEELSNKLDELHEKLWAQITKKKEEAINERQKIMHSGYIEEEMDFVVSTIQKFMQAEIERHVFSIKTVQDFYDAQQGKEIKPPEDIIIDLLPGHRDNYPPTEDHEDPHLFPRIELIYTNALTVLSGKEIDYPGKKKTKNAPKKNYEILNVTEIQEDSSENTMKAEAIAMEKNIIQYRLYLLKNIAISKVKLLRTMAQVLYNRLDDWIVFTLKFENDSTYEVIKTIKRAIERKELLDEPLEIGYRDVATLYKPIQYEENVIVNFSGLESIIENRFTITQLFSLITELASLTNDRGCIENDLLYSFLTRRLTKQETKYIFPQLWIHKDPKEYYAFIQKLDRLNLGMVEWKEVCTLICLSSAPIPDQHELNQYEERLRSVSQQGYILRDSFIDIPSFFDQTEFSNIIEGSLTWDRPMVLKDIIFHINKDLEREAMNVDYFMKILAFTQDSMTAGASPTKSTTGERTQTSEAGNLPRYIDYLFRRD